MEGLNRTADVRCPTCSKLLAKRLADGSYQIKIRDRYIATFRNGTVLCVGCSVRVSCAPEKRDMRLTFGRS